MQLQIYMNKTQRPHNENFLRQLKTSLRLSTHDPLA